MSEQNSVVAIFASHTGAEEAVKELQRGGIDMHSLSIIGKDYHTDENVVGYYNTGDRMKYWGKIGAFWGGFWGLLFGSAFLRHSGLRRGARGGTYCRVDCGSFGRRRSGGRIERSRRGTLQYRYSQRQCP